MTIGYNPPYILDAVKRQRLFKLLDDNFYKQNFLITGQAAQGKSTLMASYLQYSDQSVLWFALSEDDSDHTKLFDRLINGIHALFESHEDGDDIFIPNSTLGTENGLLRHIESLSSIFHELFSPVMIVLDDFELIDEASSGFHLINGILKNKFDYLKICVMSRNLPLFDIPRLKTENSFFVLNNNDLAFTLDETRLFFAGKPSSDSLDIERIHRITSGWAGGLALVSESVRQENVLQDLPDQLSSEAFSFFSQEIYKNLSGPVQNFLLMTSVLETIELEMVTHIFGTADALEILNALEKRNLFIQRINSGSGKPEFKYHHLFRDFLLREFLHTKSRSLFKQLNHRAGLFFWEKKDHEQALNYFCRADAFSDMARIIKIKGADYIISQKILGLEKWIRHLPEFIIKDDPWLIFFSAMTRRIKGGKKNIQDFQNALGLFEQKNDFRGMLLSVGYLIEAAVFVRQPSAMILKWIKKGEAQLLHIQQKNWYPWARALLWQQMGLGYIAGDGNIPKGVSACRNAILLGRQIDNSNIVLNAAITMTFGYVQAGDFVNARKMVLKIKNITKERQHPEYRALKGIVDIDFALKNGRLNDAGELLARSEADIEKFGLIFLYPGFIELKALHQVFIGQFDKAFQLADHLNDFSILDGNDFYKGISHRIKALSFLRSENFKNAVQEIRKAVKELNIAQKGAIHHFLAQQLSGMIYFKTREFIKAKKALIPALGYFEGISSDLCCVETCLVLGLIFWECKESKTAFTYLVKGVENAFQEGYMFFPLIGEKELLKTLLLLTAYNKINSIESYVVSLISGCDPVSIQEQINRIISSCRPREKNRLIENLRPVYKTLLPGLRIETFGRFHIFCNDKELGAKAFKGSKPIILLKSIVRHGSKDIPREILIDDLWPNARAKAGDKNFKINLHRLRKAIEPGPKNEFGYAYIVQKAGLISLDPELVTIDVDEFINFGAKAVENENNNKFETALKFYKKAVEIYKGDYFAEEPYLEWISRKRDFLKARFIELLQKKAMLHEELDQIEKAVRTWYLILDTEPYFETAYQNLMILYADSGRRQKAVDIYVKCRALLKTDLGTEPDIQTYNIYRKIKAR